MVVLYSLVALICFTVSNLLFRRVARRVTSVDTLGMLYTSLAGLFSLPLLWIEDGPLLQREPAAWLVIAAILGWTGFSYGAAWMAHHYQASTNAILGQLTTVFSIVLGLVILQEQVTVLSGLGVVIIVAANVMLSLGDATVKWDRRLLMRVGLCLVLAMNFMFDNVASPYFNRGLYIFLAFFVPGVLLWLILPGVSWKTISQTYWEDTKGVLLLSLASLIGYYFVLKAYDVGELVVIVPILQSTTITTVLAAGIFLGERDRLGLKLLSGGLVTVGLILVGIYG